MNEDILKELPPDARSAVLGLIGSTFAELKKVDEHMVSPAGGIQGVKTDIKKLIQEASTIGAPAPIAPAPQPPVMPQVPNIQQPLPNIIPQPIEVSQPILNDNPDQLQFDFFRKITPEDINKNLSDINYSLNRVLDKLNKVLKILADGNKDTQ